MTFVLWVGVGEYVWSFKWESTKHKMCSACYGGKRNDLGGVWAGGGRVGVNKVLKETLYQ